MRKGVKVKWSQTLDYNFGFALQRKNNYYFKIQNK